MGLILKMRFYLIFLTILCSELIFSQTDKLILGNLTYLHEGIYTLFSQIEDNNPKYNSCLFENDGNLLLEYISVYYYDKGGIKKALEDRILLAVQSEKKYVQFQNRLYELILLGAISIFSLETTNAYSSGKQYTSAKFYYLDLKTGAIDKLNTTNIDPIIKQDSILYSSFLDIPQKKREKILYSYVLKFNMRNPLYIKEYE